MKSRLRRFRPLAITLAFISAWVFALEGASPAAAALSQWLGRVVTNPQLAELRAVLRAAPFHWNILFDLGLAAATAGAVLVLVTRMLVESRFRATGVDALAGLRRVANAHPRLFQVLSAVPGAGFAGLVMLGRFLGPGGVWATLAAGAAMLLPALATAWVAHSGFRALVGPFAPPQMAGEVDPATTKEDFYFQAVAVTPETRAAMLGVLALSMAGIVAATSQISFVALLASVFPALAATFVFHRASRIALGMDGVLVTGTSRTRFYGYADIDATEVSRSGEVLLKRGERTVLRLQLHGEDARRRDVILARIHKGIERARELRGGGANRLAEAASQGVLSQAATGQATYRQAGASRDELWELLEAAATLPKARVSAAEALKAGCAPEERARLRIAAERCAEPAARKALLRIATFQDAPQEEEEHEEASPARARMNSIR